MPLTGWDRIFTAALAGELVALTFLLLVLAGHAVLVRFPRPTPFGDFTQRTPGARFRRTLVQTRSTLGLWGLAYLVWLLAALGAAFLLPDELPFGTPWWATWVLELHLLVVFAFGCWCVFRVWQRLSTARIAWQSNLAVGHLLQRLALTGHRVFHEVTVAGLIIDHVVVGPRGVFLINVVVRPRQRKQAPEPVRLLPVERQLEVGGVPSFEPVFEATRRVTETGKQLTQLLGHKLRPVSALIVPGWPSQPTTDGDHLVFDLTNLATLLGWAKPEHGLLEQDVAVVHEHLLTQCRDPRPV